MTIEIRRGRPPSNKAQQENYMESASPVKKGNRSWKPASTINFNNMEPGYRYKCVLNKPERISRHEQEGWEIVTRKGAAGTNIPTENLDKLGRSTDTTVKVRDTVLMRIPEEFAKEREEYYNQRTQRRTKALREEAEQQVRATGAPVYGSDFKQQNTTIF